MSKLDELTRRRFLAAAGSASIAAVAATRSVRGQSPGHSPAADPSAAPDPSASAPVPTALPVPPQGPDLVEPAVFQSQNGLLEVTLTARPSTIMVGGREVTTTVYNDSFPGPTLKMLPGDTLRITLVNDTGQETNLHTHGFHTTPLGFGDNVLHHMMPGETWVLEMPTLPDHPSGMYWYHPHVHGDSDDQVNGGMAGAIINVGPLDALPGIVGLTEHLLLVQTTQFAEDGTRVSFLDQRPDTTVRYVNGQVNPTIRIQPGETQRWRVGNFSSDTFIDIQLDGHTLHQIAQDANPHDFVVDQDHIQLGPAERTEVLVQAATEPGTYFLRSLPVNGEPEVVIATMVVEGDAVEPQALPTTLFPFEDLRTVTPDEYRTIIFEILNGTDFVINGRSFDENRVDVSAKLNAVEEWTLVNATDSWHPFHIHINDFQVVALDGRPYEANSWQDTVAIPPQGTVTMRTRFTDFPGKWVYHCHILGHECAGMMGIIEVAD
jgi:FtsP/CotA-like multicopper oxidase with cupredoxin domain